MTEPGFGNETRDSPDCKGWLLGVLPSFPAENQQVIPLALAATGVTEPRVAKSAPGVPHVGHGEIGRCGLTAGGRTWPPQLLSRVAQDQCVILVSECCGLLCSRAVFVWIRISGSLILSNPAQLTAPGKVSPVSPFKAVTISKGGHQQQPFVRRKSDELDSVYAPVLGQCERW